ncbi:MAG: glycosyltransferase family 4 protein [Candidatus Hydrogenedentota bacterium]
MKVLQISFSKSYGGMERYMVEVSKGLIKNGVEVKAICRKDTMLENALFDENIPYFSLNPINYIDVRTVMKLKEIYQNINPDIIHSHTSCDLGLIIPASWLCGEKPYVVFTMHMDTHYSKHDLYHELLFRKLKKIFAITDRVKKEVMDSWPVSSGIVKTLYNGCDVDEFNKRAGKGGLLRKRFDIPLDYKIVGIVGRLEKPKGQDTFIEACAYVKREIDKVKFVVIGGDDRKGEPFLNYLKDRVKELQMSDDVYFTGRVANVAGFLKDLDIFVMLSHCEAFGLVILEAFSLKKPVIATSTGGVQEIVSDSVDGLLVPPNEPFLTKDAIIRLLNDETLRNKLSENGYHKVKTHFEMKDKIYEVMNEYNLILQE